MRKVISAVAAVAVVATPLLLDAPADAASRYSVTLAASAAQADVGQSVTLSGQVSPKAKGERVKVQRLAGTTWTTVAKPRLNRHSRYHATVTVAAPGDNSYRVVKPRSDGHKLGISPTVTVVGWRWRSVLSLPHDTPNGFDPTARATVTGSVTLREQTFSPALVLGDAVTGNGWATYRLDGQCSMFDTHVGMTNDSTAGGALTLAFNFTGGGNDYSLNSEQAVFPNDDPVHVFRGTAVVLGVDGVYLGGGSSTPGDQLAWGNPRVYCRS